MYDESKQEILENMKNNINNDLNKGEGTYIHECLSTFAIELKKNNINMQELLNMVFIDKAFYNGYDEEVIERCKEQAIYRKDGKKAEGIVTFIGAEDTEIPKNFLVQTKNNIIFKTLEEKIIDKSGFVDIKVQAKEEGTKYNVKENTITEIPVQIVGLTEVKNKEPIINGIDIETIEDLYKRYKIKVSTPATSGNKYHYKLWALEVQGVEDCIVKPCWNGNGTIKLILIGSNRNKPTEEVIKNVKKHIEEVRPVCGGELTVVGIEEVNINISVNIEIDKTTTKEKAREEIENNIKDYFKNMAFKEKVIRFTRLASCILDVEGVLDYSNLKINNNTENIKLNDEQVGILKEVMVNEQ